ncbi:MAG: InlB B-repeat-containing protein, partial [Methylococcus sp.]|nr:InlB B-repeat-containing protein [Methylococcus sp.]
RFGESVGIAGATVVAGASGINTSAGAAYVYSLQNPLDVTVAAGGTVTSIPAGINCAGAKTCTADFDTGSTVTLTAAPVAGYTFTGWGGVCSGSAPTCTVVMSADQTVSATFAVAPTPTPNPTATPSPTAEPFPIATPTANYALQIEVVGASGSVTSQPVGIDCGTVCSQTFPAGSAVYLTAVPKPGYEFVGWLDCDAIQKDLVCRMTLTGPKPRVVASFRPDSGATPSPAPGVTPAPTPVPTTTPAPSASPAPTAAPTPVPTTAPNPTPTPAPAANQAALNVVTVGAGVVNSSEGGIDCGPVCSASYDLGSVVTLTAVPAEGYKFKRWIGAGCSGRKPCTVTLNRAKTVKAKFVRNGKS